MDDLIQFCVNSEKPRDAAMRNTGTGFVVLSHHSLFICLFLSLFVSFQQDYEKTTGPIFREGVE